MTIEKVTTFFGRFERREVLPTGTDIVLKFLDTNNPLSMIMLRVFSPDVVLVVDGIHVQLPKVATVVSHSKENINSHHFEVKRFVPVSAKGLTLVASDCVGKVVGLFDFLTASYLYKYSLSTGP